MTIHLDLIRIDGGTQSRTEIDHDTVDEYAKAMRGGAVFPPLTVFHDGAFYWLADGFHRYHASKAAGFVEINAEIKNGTQRDAVLFSVGANASHGLRRTNADKRRAVLRLLDDSEWSQRSDRWIAEQARVSDKTVAAVRADIQVRISEPEAVRADTQVRIFAPDVTGQGAEIRTCGPSERIGQDGKTYPASRPVRGPMPKAADYADDFPAYKAAVDAWRNAAPQPDREITSPASPDRVATFIDRVRNAMSMAPTDACNLISTAIECLDALPFDVDEFEDRYAAKLEKITRRAQVNA